MSNNFPSSIPAPISLGSVILLNISGMKLHIDLLQFLLSVNVILIHIGKPIELDEEKFLAQLQHLKEYVVQEPDDIRSYIQDIVQTYSIQNR